MAKSSKRQTIDKDRFIEKIRSLEASAKIKGYTFTMEEIDACFENTDLTDAQRKLVYQYLKESQDKLESDNQANDESMRLSSATFKMYVEDLQNIAPCATNVENALYDRLSAGDRTAIHELLKQWLPRVLEIVKTYKIPAKDMEDAIQEANMGVFIALDNLLDNSEKANINNILQQAAKDAVEEYLQNAAAVRDMDESIVAKAALVYEAQIYLAEELQRLPSTEELSQYTRLSERELTDILAMSKEK